MVAGRRCSGNSVEPSMDPSSICTYESLTLHSTPSVLLSAIHPPPRPLGWCCVAGLAHPGLHRWCQHGVSQCNRHRRLCRLAHIHSATGSPVGAVLHCGCAQWRLCDSGTSPGQRREFLQHFSSWLHLTHGWLHCLRVLRSRWLLLGVFALSLGTCCPPSLALALALSLLLRIRRSTVFCSRESLSPSYAHVPSFFLSLSHLLSLSLSV
jgi:hypothetical protein